MHILQTKLLKILGKVDFSKTSLRQLTKIVGEKYPQKVKHHIEQLEKKGLVSINWNTRRLFKVQRGAAGSPLISVPILGSANCGPAAIFADENIEGYVKISKTILGLRTIGDFFAIRAFGNSMNKADVDGRNIEQGDIVIIDPKEKSPKNGDYVLSIIDNVATIKKFVLDRENRQVVLLAESTDDYPPIYIDPSETYFVSGKVKYVIKKPKIRYIY